MTSIVWALLGLFVGAFLIAFGVALYFILSTMKDMIVTLKRMISTLSPVLESDDLPRSFKAFAALATQGEMLTGRMDQLIATIQKFYKVTFASRGPADTTGSSESAVYYVDEEEASAREAAFKLRKQGIETEEGRVSQSKSELANDSPVF